MTAQELYEIVRKEIDVRASTDPAFRQAQRNIDSGNGDFTDSAQCSRILAGILGEKLANHILELPPDGGRSELCKCLLKNHFDEVSRKFTQVQSGQDRKRGIGLGTVKPKFPAERAGSVAGSLNDTSVSDEVIQRRCRNAVANAANSMHDSFVKENAKFRNDAGLLVKITRISGAKPCPWCAEVSGTFIGYSRELANVFRRHDNCHCTIIYTSEKTYSRLTGSKKSWQERPLLPDARPTRFTQEQARQFEAEQLRKQGLVRDGDGVKYVGNGLTNGGGNGTINGRSSGTNATNSTQHWFEKIGTIAPENIRAIAEYLQDFEEKYHDSQIEHCRVITASGEIYDVHGDRYTVDTTLLGEKMSGSINEHNHVTGESQYSFSEDDLRESAKDGSKIAIAFDEKYRYSMQFPNESISEELFYEAYQKAIESVGDDLIFNPEKIPIGDEQHEKIKRACEYLGIKYTRKTISF